MNSYSNKNKTYIRWSDFSQMAKMQQEVDFSDIMKMSQKSAIRHDLMFTPDR